MSTRVTWFLLVAIAVAGIAFGYLWGYNTTRRPPDSRNQLAPGVTDCISKTFGPLVRDWRWDGISKTVFARVDADKWLTIPGNRPGGLVSKSLALTWLAGVTNCWPQVEYLAVEDMNGNELDTRVNR